MIGVGAKLKWRSYFGERTGTVLDQILADDNHTHLIGYHVSPDDKRAGYPVVVTVAEVIEEIEGR